MKYVFGHKNPDTDSVMSAIVMAEYLNKKGIEAKAFRQGNITKEVQFVLDYLKIDAPELLPELESGTEVVLVDHNDPTETLDNLSDLVVTDVVDHHAVKLNTSYPLNYRAESVGCTNTVLYKMFKEANFEISKRTASMMLSAIISDSLLFKSPTYTAEDKEVVAELIKISEIDAEKYGLELLKAGTDMSDISAENMLFLDAKSKEDFNTRMTVAQVNTADVNDVLKREEELKDAINKYIADNNTDLFMLLITDIVNGDSTAIAMGEKVSLAEEAFGVKIVDDKMFLKGVMSRKKQILPPLENALKNK